MPATVAAGPPAADCAADRPLVTPRQLAVVEAYIATGSVKEAATLLGISTYTLADHLRLARARYGVGTTTQLVFRLAVQGHLVGPDVTNGTPDNRVWSSGESRRTL